MKPLLKNHLIIYKIHGIEENIQLQAFGIWQKEPANYARLIGNFYYNNLLLEGQLLLPIKELNRIIRPIRLSVRKNIQGVRYYYPLDAIQAKTLRQQQCLVECLGDDATEDPDDENFTFLLLFEKL